MYTGTYPKSSEGHYAHSLDIHCSMHVILAALSAQNTTCTCKGSLLRQNV